MFVKHVSSLLGTKPYLTGIPVFGDASHIVAAQQVRTVAVAAEHVNLIAVVATQTGNTGGIPHITLRILKDAVHL